MIAGWTRRLRQAAPLLLLAALAYVPLAFTAPGKVGADTKTYLYLDPGRLLARATSMWDPNVGLGTVTHQNIGYLFPMGPYYWLMDAARVPDWFAQRLWLGTILFAAGTGVLFLLRTLGWSDKRARSAALVAALAYMLTPFILTLAARLSVILLPWAGLPWLVALAARSIRRGGWRDPALFALVVVTVGGVNATALVFAGVAPVLWFPHAVWVAREASARRAAAAFLRIGVLTVLTSLWWLSGLVTQGRYGIDILRYTETAKAVATTSTAPEVLRGLGYWFFYGGDRIGPWIEPARDYMERLWLLAVTYAIPILALLGGVLSRWRHRAYFVALVLAGTFIAVGAYPWGHPPATGSLWKSFQLSDAGLALRSTARAVPLIALGTSVLLGSGLAALAARVPRLARPAAAAIGALVIAGLPALYTGGMVASNLDRPERLPGYWTDAAAYLDSHGDGTRVLEVPGADFASYRWGNTVDPITPGLIDRPYVARELIPYGSPASTDLLNALDRRMQENVLDPAAVAPVARLMGVGDVVVRSDLQYERYRTPRPRPFWELLTGTPGLGSPVGFGAPVPNRPSVRAPLLDELELATPPGLPDPPPVGVLPVDDPLPIVRTAAASGPVVVAGDGEGIVEAAAAGLLDGRELIQYAASSAGPVPPDASLILTDTNRRRARRWSSVRDNTGYTETAGEEPLRDDASDNRLAVFPDAGDSAFTVAEQRGGVAAQATAYGNAITYTPEFRAANAVDGDLGTSWRVGQSSDVRGEQLVVTYDPPMRASDLRLVQVLDGFRNRRIAEADLRLDDGPAQRVVLDGSSLAAAGQEISFTPTTFSRLTLTIRSDDAGPRVRYGGLSAVGITELTVGNRHLDEIIRLPDDLLARQGAGSVSHPLAVLLARQRSDPAEPLRDDEETHLAREFTVPATRSFLLTGVARPSARAADNVLDGVLGTSDDTASATSSRRLPGDVEARASRAVDGDPSTAWTSAFGTGDDWLEFRTLEPSTFDHLDIDVVDDGRHSVPTRVRIDADGTTVASLDLPADGRVELPATITASTVRITVEAVREVTTIDWFTNAPIRMPVAIAELGNLVTARRGTGALNTGCRDDVVTIDGRAVRVRVTGTTVTACDGAIELAEGPHELRTAIGRDGGIDVDRLVLQSAAGGSAVAHAGAVPASRDGGPALVVDGETRTSYDLAVTGARPGEPFWVVLGQSLSDGWHASAGGHDLGPPQLVDGYANGWLVDPTSADVHVALRWTPQGLVTVAELASLLAALACIGLAVAPRRRRAPVVSVERELPHLRGFDSPDLLPRRPAAIAGVALVLALAFAAMIGPVAGAVAGLALVAAALAPRVRVIVALAAPGCLAAAALYIIAKQAHGHAFPAFEWPAEVTSAVHQLGWLAVALLVVDVVVERLAVSRRRTGDEPGRA